MRIGSVQAPEQKIYPTENVLQSRLRILQNERKILEVNKQNIIGFHPFPKITNTK